MCSDFSGGGRCARAARLLLSGPDVLFLDEPTNHLDSAARAWLATYLASYEGTLVLVSHDTAMLKRACDSIAEITGDAPTADKPGSGRRLETYKSCSFDQWRQQRAERAQRWVSTYERQKEEERDLEDFIRRFGAKASKATQAKDREQKLKRLREEMVDRPHDAIDQGRRSPTRSKPPRAQRDGAPEENLGDTVASPLLKVRGGPAAASATLRRCLPLQPWRARTWGGRTRARRSRGGRGGATTNWTLTRSRTRRSS